MGGEIRQRLAGGDRQEHRALVGEAAQIGQHDIHGLRLDRQHHDLRCFADLLARRHGAQAWLVRPQRLDRLGDDRVRCRKAARQPAVEHGAAHLAASDQQQLAHRQRPLNLAGRFSRKAVAPSLRSSLPAIFSSL